MVQNLKGEIRLMTKLREDVLNELKKTTLTLKGKLLTLTKRKVKLENRVERLQKEILFIDADFKGTNEALHKLEDIIAQDEINE